LGKKLTWRGFPELFLNRMGLKRPDEKSQKEAGLQNERKKWSQLWTNAMTWEEVVQLTTMVQGRGMQQETLKSGGEANNGSQCRWKKVWGSKGKVRIGYSSYL